MLDINTIRAHVPEWSNEVINQVNTPETRNNVIQFLKKKLDSFFDEAVVMNSFDIGRHITKKYGIDNVEDCVATLTKEASDLSSRSWKVSWVLISLIFILFLLYFAISPLHRTELHYYALLLGAIALLFGGIVTPMIDIDARIVNFELLFLGESIRFHDQVMYFQSKSILDVVMLLINEGDAQTMSVGVLIFIFSIIFPGIKLIVSALAYRFTGYMRKNAIANFFMYESAKWSMADVMVVAIFMAYIGFSSIIGAQLEHFSGFDNAQLLSTHKHTTLQMGFFIFTAYCMSGLVLGYAVKKRVKSYT